MPPDCTVRINKDHGAPQRARRPDERDLQEQEAVPDKVLFLAAQEKLNYEGIVQILDVARAAPART